jgi:uncharacterized membrane protein
MMHNDAAIPLVRRPIHPTLASFPTACFAGTLLTDIVYWRTAEMMWADFSAWLIATGVILGWLAAIAGILDLAGRRYLFAPVPAWAYALATLIVLILATLNMLIHTRDAWTSVVPWGLVLSAATVILLIFTTWIGWTALYRRSVRVLA